MAEGKDTLRWRVVGHTVRGASHLRGGLPNQDAIHWHPESGEGLPLILAVADGHGSNKSFRSETGAHLAVQTTVEVIRQFLRGQIQSGNLSATKRAAEEWLPVAIVRRWLEAVTEHMDAHPVDAEKPRMPGRTKSESIGLNSQTLSSLAYGTTILSAVVTDEFILFLQLGDGEILSVSNDGTVTSPLPKDQRLFANETTSLCSQDAWRDFRVSFQVLSSTPPALILLSTDGYPNSFREETGFHKVGSDVLKMIRADGLEMVNSQIEAWLTESTNAGSGDDVTLGLICSALEPQMAKSVNVSRSKKNSTHTEIKREETNVSAESEG